MEAVKSYDTRVDAKGRITLRGATYTNYNVRMFENGCFLIEPRELTVPEGISVTGRNGCSGCKFRGRKRIGRG